MENVVRMLYRQYKKSYADCKTVPGSYDKGNKSIEVIVPDGRMKPSGTRGQSYEYIWFDGVDVEGKPVRVCIKAVSTENAVKRLAREYPTCTFDLSGWSKLA